MPPSLASRNFVVSAIPFIEIPEDKPNTWRRPPESLLSRKSTQVAPLLVFSSSFLNGSFCPELITQEGTDNPESLRRLFAFCADNSSTLQFATSLPGLASRMNKDGIHDAFNKLITESRYFVRQLRHLELETNSICLSSVYLPRLTALHSLKFSDYAEYEEKRMGMRSAARLLSNLPLHEGYDGEALVYPSESIHVMNSLSSLLNLESLKIDSREFLCPLLYRQLWTLNPMKYLTSLDILMMIDFAKEDQTSRDLSFISSAHPQLKKLHLAVMFANDQHQPPELFTPPNLARLTQLEDFKFRAAHVNSALLQKLVVEGENDKKSVCPYLTRIFFYRPDEDEMSEIIEHFFEKIDGSLVTNLIFGFIDDDFELWRDDARVEFLSEKFPLLHDVSLCPGCTNKSLKMIGQNMEAGSLVDGLTIDFVSADDDGISHLFDPSKAVRGCYKSLRSLTFACDDSRSLTGKGWFGDNNEAFMHKQFALRELHFVGRRINLTSEGFSEILVAFSHCLEVLTMPDEFQAVKKVRDDNDDANEDDDDDDDDEPFSPSEKLLQCRLPMLTTLNDRHNMSWYHDESFRAVVPLCPSLHTVNFYFASKLDVDAFAENVIDSESKCLEINADSLPARLQRSTCDRLLDLKCLRKIEVSNVEDGEDSNDDSDDQSIPLENLVGEFREKRKDVKLIGFPY